MKEENDDQLQRWLEGEYRRQNQPPIPNAREEDLHLYRQLFDELATEPPAGVSYGFSERVIRQIQRQEAIRRERTAYVVFGSCLLLLLLVPLMMMAVFRVNDLSSTFRSLDVVKYPALFGLLLLGLVQWADHRFVKRKDLTR